MSPRTRPASRYWLRPLLTTIIVIVFIALSLVFGFFLPFWVWALLNIASVPPGLQVAGVVVLVAAVGAVPVLSIITIVRRATGKSIVWPATLALMLAVAMGGAVVRDIVAPTVVPVDAQEVVAILKAHNLPIGETVAYTAESDPDRLMGLPGSYASKAGWRDTTLGTDGPLTVQSGGIVEVFPDEATAAQRGRDLARAVLDRRLSGENRYIKGRIVLRLSGRLSQGQPEKYFSALSKVER